MAKPTSFIRSLSPTAALLCLLTLNIPPVQADLLARPPGLQPDIQFWRRIFTEYSTRQGVIHDDQNLGMVYGVIELNPGMSGSQRSKAYERAASGYKAILTTLANGKREGLSAEEMRVLALWPSKVSKQQLTVARSHLRMQQGLSDRFREGLIRSGLWLDHIRASLKKAGVPEELAALPHVESSFNPDAYSHVGAAGLWQFTRSTGKRFMQVDHIVDERRDPYRSSEAAALLLQYNYSILQNWPLAITAYNHGAAGMRRAVQQLGTTDIETILRNYQGRTFGFASRNFYVAFLAALEAERNHEKYFGPLQRARPQQYEIVVMPDYIPANTLSEILGVPLTALHAVNAALMAPVWNGSKYVPRGYPLRLPTGLSGKQIAAIPAQFRYRDQTPDEFHKIAPGDTLSGIAARYHTSVSRLVALNSLNSQHRIRAGQTLRLPYKDGLAATSLATMAAANIETDKAVAPPVSASALASAAQASAPVPEVDTPALLAGNEATLDSLEPEDDQAPAADNETATVPADRLLADPSDYLVAADGSIEVQAEETLGHYADWLNIATQPLRDVNRYSFARAVIVGQRVKLDFTRVSQDAFVARRITYHSGIQDAFFSRYRISSESVHTIRPGDSLWELTQVQYKLPLWLRRQYNPDLELDKLVPGTKVLIPRISPVTDSADSSLAAQLHVHAFSYSRIARSQKPALYRSFWTRENTFFFNGL